MDAYKSISEPKIVIAVGACAISGGVFADSDELNRELFNTIKIDLFIPGCSAASLTIINAILGFIGRNNTSNNLGDVLIPQWEGDLSVFLQ